MAMQGQTLALFGLPGHWEAVIVILALLLLFGGSKLPELARGLGKGLRIFKKELHEVKDSVENEEKDEQPSQEKKKLGSSESKPPEDNQQADT